MEQILKNQDYMLVELGIETGSVELLKKTMASKVKPFKPNQWPELILEALGKMHDNMVIPFCSLIFGLPGETIDDKEKTLELIKEIEDYRSILFPVNFVSLGELTDKKSYSKDLKALHEIDREICFRCVDHNLKWINKFKGLLYIDSTHKFLLDLLSKIWIFQYKRNLSIYNKRLT
jgi:radical SAM superfamily enzyme YgiQ (UPF0313 family)